MRYALTIVAFLLPSSAFAGEVTIVDVKATQQNVDVYRFDVTLEHADSGWDHYANRWDVLSPDGAVLGSRVLAHPHVNEQPFTRALTGVRIPSPLASVRIRAHDSVHGDSSELYTVRIPR